jgi:hypothetical protein
MKEKQIEEMAELLIDIQRDFNEYCAKPCRECELAGTVNCENIYKSEALYNAGYRKQEWIRVEDRLPEDVYGKDKKQIVVLVHTKSGRISSASRVRECKFDKTKLKYVELDTFGWSRGLRVSHWMQLPDAPKGGEGK